MNKMNIKKGDEVVVLSGKDRQKKGKVLEVLPKKDMVIVEGVNMATRTLPLTPLSLPDRTITVSFFLMFILRSSIR